MSTFLAPGLFLLCVFIGNGKAGALRKRKETLTAMEADIRRLAEQMELRPGPIAALLTRFEAHTEAFWQIFQRMLGEEEAPVAALWQAAVEKAAESHNGFEFLSKDERAILADFGAGLSGSGIAAQRANAALACRRLQQRVCAVEEELAKKGKLFESLGVLAGLALALLVI